MYVLRNIPLLLKVESDLPSKWDFGHRKGLVPDNDLSRRKPSIFMKPVKSSQRRNQAST
jgi:hypothetical protein